MVFCEGQEGSPLEEMDGSNKQLTLDAGTPALCENQLQTHRTSFAAST